jgi:hypothetical protein
MKLDPSQVSLMSKKFNRVGKTTVLTSILISLVGKFNQSLLKRVIAKLAIVEEILVP